MKVIDGGIQTITSGGSGRDRGRATSSELSGLIEGLAATGKFSSRDIDGIRTVFKKELAQKEKASSGFSLFSTPRGISATKFFKNTLGSQSVQNQIYSSLKGHDKTRRTMLASQVAAIAKGALSGGSGSERGRMTKPEIDAMVQNLETMGGYTKHDVQSVQNVLYKALGEKPSTTPTLHPLSTGQVIHKKTAQAGVTPPPSDGTEKPLSPSKSAPPVMHTPHIPAGHFIPVAMAVAPAWKDRPEHTHTEHDIPAENAGQNKPTQEAIAEIHTAETIPDTPSRVAHHTSSTPTFQERIAQRRAKQEALSQANMGVRGNDTTHATEPKSSTQHVSSTQHTSSTPTFKERLAQRQKERESLNKPEQKASHHEDSSGMGHASSTPHISSTHSFTPPKQEHHQAPQESQKSQVPQKSIEQQIEQLDQNQEEAQAKSDDRNTNTVLEESASNSTPSALVQEHHEHGQVEHVTDTKAGAKNSPHTGTSETPHMSFTPYKTSTHIPTFKEQEHTQTSPEQQQGVITQEEQETGGELEEAASTESENTETDNTPETPPRAAAPGAVPGAPSKEQGVQHHETESKEVQHKVSTSEPEVSNPLLKLRMPHLNVSNTKSVRRRSSDEEASIETNENTVVEIRTNQGAIAIELFIQEAPVTAGTFLTLAKNGSYNGVPFHRVVDGYVIQAGESLMNAVTHKAPQNSDGSHVVEDESRSGLANNRGTVSMVHTGEHAGGGLFSINVVPNHFLNGKYPVFGKVLTGMDVVDAIAKTPTDSNDAPVKPIVIESISVPQPEEQAA